MKRTQTIFRASRLHSERAACSSKTETFAKSSVAKGARHFSAIVLEHRPEEFARTKGNLTGFGSTQSYQYDSQNRLISATNGSNTMTFKYDGLNRQVSRTLNTSAPIYSVWDGWNLIEEVQNGNVTAAYLYGTTGIIKNLNSGNY